MSLGGPRNMSKGTASGLPREATIRRAPLSTSSRPSPTEQWLGWSVCGRERVVQPGGHGRGDHAWKRCAPLQATALRRGGLRDVLLHPSRNPAHACPSLVPQSRTRMNAWKYTALRFQTEQGHVAQPASMHGGQQWTAISVSAATHPVVAVVFVARVLADGGVLARGALQGNVLHRAAQGGVIAWLKGAAERERSRTGGSRWLPCRAPTPITAQLQATSQNPTLTSIRRHGQAVNLDGLCCLDVLHGGLATALRRSHARGRRAWVCVSERCDHSAEH